MAEPSQSAQDTAPVDVASSDSLTAPEISDLIQSIKNKRHHTRTEFAAIVHVFELDGLGTVTSTGVETRAFDLSRGGIGLHSRRMYYPGAQLVLRLALPGFLPRILGGVVKYSRYRERGLYHIGIEFAPLPNNQTFRTWLSQQQAEMNRNR